MLDHLLSPLPTEEFFETYWETRPLHVSATDRSRFGAFLGFATLDRVLAVLPDNKNLFLINNTEGSTKTQVFLTKDEKESLPSLYDRFSQGNTLLINGLDGFWEPVARLARQLTMALGCFVNVNSYITPRQARGFKPHWDDHDVFVLQTGGEKEWHLFEGGPELPRRYEGYALEDGPQSVGDPGEPSQILRMCAGDLLYLPRGTIHQAVTTASASMHLTVGLFNKTWEDLAVAAVQDAARRNPLLRRALPPNTLANAAPAQPLDGGLQEAMHRVRADLDPIRAATSLKLEMIQRIKPLAEGHFVQVMASGEIHTGTSVERMPDMVFHVDQERGNPRLFFPGTVVDWPSKMSWALSFLEKSERFRVEDIPGWYSAEEKVILVKHLIRRGFLRVAD